MAEFNEKLQKLRIDRGMTQEELAEQLYVSRTAISKWESGRGYPSLDSMKDIAKYFNVTIDYLISGEEIISLAEDNIKATNKKYVALICGVLDCLMILLLFIPIFACENNGTVDSVILLSLTDVSTWTKIVMITLIGVCALNGFVGIIMSNFNNQVWNKHRIVTGLVISGIATAFFILTRQPYPAFYALILLIAKGAILIKNKQ